MGEQVTACVEVGASGVETVLLGAGQAFSSHPHAHEPVPGTPLLIAVPGLVEGGRVIAASNVGWYDVDPARELGFSTGADLVCNDAEAAALGESVLRPGHPELVFVGLGTGVGGAVVTSTGVEANLFAHQRGFGSRVCSCTGIGCLETVAGGWALPPTLSEADLATTARAVAQAVDRETLATPRLVVLAGGLARRYPVLRELLAATLPGRDVETSAATGTKSAAPWGLRHLWQLGQEPAQLDLSRRVESLP